MKPTIYLGIGGTGNKAIAYAKKHYEEEFGVGNIPGEIAFIGFDFQIDMDEDPDLATDISADFIKINSSANPKQMYEVGRETYNKYNWMPKGNESNVDDRISKGAKSVRTTGRLYTEITLSYIIPRITNVINRVLDVSGTAQNVQGGVNIYMAMSLAGGTGAGSFITIATEIKEQFDNKVNLYGFGLTHGVFEAMDPLGNKMPNVLYNGISSIVDLDFLFTASRTNPIVLEHGNRKIERTSPIFDNFFVIDNKSESGYVIQDVNELCEMLGLCLYSYGGDAGAKVEAVLNNVNYKTRNYDVKTKLGWVMGVGACQVVYKGQHLANIYGMKAASKLIYKMRTEDADIRDKVLPWIKEVGLREDNINDERVPHDQLTDAICAPSVIKSIKLPNIDQSNSDQANKQVCQSYLADFKLFPSDKVIEQLRESKKTELNNKVNTLLKGEGAVGNALSFVRLFQTYCEQYQSEMRREVEELTQKQSDKVKDFDNKAYNNYIAEKHGVLTLNRAARNQELLENLVSYPACEILKLSYEIKRRDVASNIYNSLISYADELYNKLEILDANLKLLETSLDKSVIQRQSSGNSLVFEYDLSVMECEKMKVDKADVSVVNFVQTLKNISLFDLETEDALKEKILAYTENLPQAKWYKEILLSQVIEKLSDDDYKKMKDEIERKSSRWLQVNDRGEYVNINNQKSVADAVVKNWIVSYYPDGDNKFRLEEDGNFAKNVLSKDYLPTVSDTTKQRMIFTCIDGCIIPYCIDSLDEIAMDKYNNLIGRYRAGEAFNPHYDLMLFERMMAEDFKLKPEMQNEAMFYWVCAQLFGVNIVEKERVMVKDANGLVSKEDSKIEATHTKLLAFIGGKYMYWDEKSRPGKYQKWQALGNTSRREKAFNVFKTVVLPYCKDDLKKKILADYKQRVAYWGNQITSLKSVTNGGSGSFEDYIDRVVCSDKSSATYFAQDTAELALLQDEFDFLEQKLINQLSLLK